MTLIAIIYLVGVVVAYVTNRSFARKRFNTYTHGDRIVGFAFSIFSWIGFLVVFIVYLDTNKPAKW